MNINELLYAAAHTGKLETIKFLVEKGANIRACDDMALRNASLNGHLEVVKYLVEQGADIHAIKDIYLKYAAYNGHLEVVKYLVENDADVHAEDDCALRNAKTQEIKDYLQKIINNKNNSKIQEKIKNLKKELSEQQKNVIIVVYKL